MDSAPSTADAKSTASRKQWTLFFQRCLQQRISDEKFQSLAKALRKRAPLDGLDVCDALLHHQLSSNPEKTADPLVARYSDELLHAQVIKAHQALNFYWRHSIHHLKAAKQQNGEAHEDESKAEECLPLVLEESLFSTLAQGITTTFAPRSVKEAKILLKASAEWMRVLVGANAPSLMNDGAQQTQYQVTQRVLQVRQVVGLFVLALLEDLNVQKILSAESSDIVKSFAGGLTSYGQLLSASNLVDIENQLAMAQQSYESLQLDSTNAMGDNDGSNTALGGMQLNNIMDAPLVPARSSLTVYLDTLLYGAPLINDTVLIHYLRSRYNDDSNAMMWLVVASFDVLASAVKRTDVPSERMFLLRSFIVNKVPHILLSITRTTFTPTNVEFVLSHALSELDPSMFGSFASGFEMANRETSMLSDTWQDFLFACALYELIPVDSIERLLQSDPMQSVPTRLVKTELVETSSGSTQKLEQLIGRLESTDGNGGVVVEALTEIFRGLCASKDTISLKGLCNQLSRRPLSLDVISLFVNPAVFLQPLCQLIENWSYDDDQGEYQPVYEEFSACLLLVMAFVWRYRLTPTEIGVTPGQGFISRFFGEGHVSRNLDELSETQDKQLAGWTKELFETQGISDELMKICPPQDFYMLVPTFLKQSIIACRMEILGIDTLKTGLELLLEAFLLPSLPYALLWLTEHVRQSPPDAQISVPILQTLIMAPKIHGEALSMHTTILALTARPLINIMSEIRRFENPNNPQSQRQELDSMLKKLKPHADYPRVPDITNTDIGSWSSPPQNVAVNHQHRLGANLTSGLRNTLQVLTLWSSQGPSSTTVSMPTYTCSQLQANIQLLGALPTLRGMVEEIKAQYNGGLPDLAFDIVTNMIASTEIRRKITTLTLSALPMPIPTHSLRESSQLTLIEALQLELEDGPKIILTDHPRAEILVQLSRAVDRTLTIPPAATEAAISVAVDVPPVPVDLQTAAPANVDVPVDVMPGLGDLGDGTAGIDQSFMDDLGLGQPQPADGGLDAAISMDLDDFLPATQPNQSQSQQDQNQAGDDLDEIFSGLGNLGDEDLGSFF